MSTKQTASKNKLHPRNKHKSNYDFDLLCSLIPELKPYVFINQYNNQTIDFSNNQAVLLLNKSLLIANYGLSFWDIPSGSLCPPIPGRADYIHYLADLLKETNNNKIPHKEVINVLDIGTGANCIYPIIGASQYNWKFVGTDVNDPSITSAKNIVQQNNALFEKVEIRKQLSTHSIFSGVIKENEKFDLTLCNPPFHSSEKEATKGSQRKWNNLNKNKKPISNSQLNFGGTSNELWCQGGEMSFIHKMIKESRLFSSQILWFTCLVSKKEHIRPLQLTLKKANCVQVKVVKMEQGHKTNRFIAWSFLSPEQVNQWRDDRFNN
ncbi:23S rRNA (adenine(1618)-N(6))-methyltransferase RlmF [Pseudocolwellia agarivorans]|uniref:23S rRNA (adenine(1618)-N(6))-methyltransferase RlmF n=1 Tax=Pseudocolwellia agarivorans TaxID=1911682 RepID=UPI00158DEDB9|nr:23S rRNA (adenine(1618)-N(6))-methyltransferase RlmF [Pseudocolwellia agarivorans]